MGKFIITNPSFWVGLLAMAVITLASEKFNFIDPTKPLFGNFVSENIEDLSTDEMVDASDDPIVVELGFGGDKKKSVRPEMEAYVKRFHKVAIKEQELYGIPASIGLAQGILESASGTSVLSCEKKGRHLHSGKKGPFWKSNCFETSSRNHFGMKCFKKGHTHKNRHKGICTNMEDDKITDYFRTFDSAWASWRAHSVLLKGTDRYKFLFKSNDYKKWAFGLQNAGYATSKTYAVKLITLIETLKLQRFDEMN